MNTTDTANESKNRKVALAFGVPDGEVSNALAKWRGRTGVKFDVWSMDGPDLHVVCGCAPVTPDAFSKLTAHKPLAVLGARLMFSEQQRLFAYLDAPEDLSRVRRSPYYFQDEREEQPFEPEDFVVLIVERLPDITLAADTVANQPTVTFELNIEHGAPMKVVVQIQDVIDAARLFEGLQCTYRLPLVALTIMSIEDGVLMAELRTDRSAIVNLDTGLAEIAKPREPVTETVKAA